MSPTHFYYNILLNVMLRSHEDQNVWRCTGDIDLFLLDHSHQIHLYYQSQKKKSSQLLSLHRVVEGEILLTRKIGVNMFVHPARCVENNTL